MTSIGSLIFCADCGNLLEPSTGNRSNILTCACCGAENQDVASKTITTRSKPSAFPSQLRQTLSVVQTVKPSDRQAEATIKMTCMECGRKEVKYSQVQLRSADEGTTIFCACECGHKWTVNN